MFHHRLWTLHRTPLYRNRAEARRLWRTLVAAFPELIALCVMPDHIHVLLPHADPDGRLGQWASAYARWRNHQRGEKGAVFAPHPPVEEVPEKRWNRVIRYVLLNPCRAGLVADPLAWPWSTHRDRVGLASPRIGPKAKDPAAFHRYVSSDPTVAPAGTALPRPGGGTPSWEAVASAVCAVTRCDPAELRRRGGPRTLALRLAWHRGLRDVAALASATDLRRSRIFEVVGDVPAAGATLEPALAAAAAALGDPRFA